MITNNHIKDIPVLSCTDIVKSYDDGAGKISVLNQISLQIQASEKLAIVGASGSGKSSLLHILSGLDSPTSGKVYVNGLDIWNESVSKQASIRNQHLGFVYQFHHLLNEFSALENVAMPLRIAKRSKDESEQKAEEALTLVGLSHRLSHPPGKLSGGERQRVAIARAIVHRPDIMLADEPTGNLDSKTGEQIYDLLLSIQAETKMALVIVTHDLKLASQMERSLTLDNGKLITL
ncbi:ABC transporter ATP-binding protein [Alteromonas sp. 5E99-2]|uniref:ABC transporter ATP-binding protein n=1 Tax=Alteromonas sp. 5E99-2 TaxID=2817683 RepID=UPI001A99C3FB|nr:ABC transporter ATP-binding protein [Alteromonas sp. 5E99-2]MBO1254944.1 ABC transporter ATP-binding protein [Alteromonas sp. 5E99-2]